jgi:hypothetical protein
MMHKDDDAPQDSQDLKNQIRAIQEKRRQLRDADDQLRREMAYLRSRLERQCVHRWEKDFAGGSCGETHTTWVCADCGLFK